MPEAVRQSRRLSRFARQRQEIPSPRSRLKSGHLLALILGAGLTAGAFSFLADARKPATSAGQMKAAQTSAPPQRLPSSYYELLAMSPDELRQIDIALMNLLCAKGLPGAENLDVPAILARLDDWAAKVKFETQRHLYRVTDPRYAEHYKHSEARLRAEFIVQVLQEDCGVHYNLERIRNVDFSRPQDLFIHGMVDNDNGGTCSSMPVMYAAIGKRLGYPLKLVLAKQHIFCRWDDEKDRFNIEGATNGGVNYYPDEYYRTWPIPITGAEMKSGEFLKSLTPQEELASFIAQRACCLQAHRQVEDERSCLKQALAL